jgi:hypothetical protein
MFRPFTLRGLCGANTLRALDGFVGSTDPE